jgi:exodeoxyribonuclease V
MDQKTTTLASYFPFDPTVQQLATLEAILRFALKQDSEQFVYVLKGYAGTGKTSLISAIVKALAKTTSKIVLMAPTGRAAKVMTSYTKKPAFTIHKQIYRQKKALDISAGFQLDNNLYSNTLFVVDEASMIANEAESKIFGNEGLLSDIIKYVQSGKNCKILFVGDQAQLPPVGHVESPALDVEYIQRNFFTETQEVVFTEVLRQEQDSGILHNATLLRNFMDEGLPIPKLSTRKFKDIYAIHGDKLQDGLEYAFKKHGFEQTKIICRSNKQAIEFNQQIRNRLLFREEEISSGDQMIVVKNNYMHGLEAGNSFIANGDTITIKRLRNKITINDFDFIDAVVVLNDVEGEPEIHCKLLLNTINSNAAALSAEENKSFLETFQKEYAHIKNKKERYEPLRKDPFFNALQVKFAYAITCHKAQGGQWDCVFLHQGYITEEMMDKEYKRWLYTAITRATKELYLVNFPALLLE